MVCGLWLFAGWAFGFWLVLVGLVGLVVLLSAGCAAGYLRLRVVVVRVWPMRLGVCVCCVGVLLVMIRVRCCLLVNSVVNVHYTFARLLFIIVVLI